MHVLHVTLGFLPAEGWGGPVKTVHQTGVELVRRGHRVTVYSTNLLDKRRVIEPGTFERDVDGMRVVYFHTWRIPRWPGTLGPVWLPDLGARLRSELRTFDVVHLNGYRNLMLLPIAVAARREGIPFVIQPHGTAPVIVNTFLLKRAYDRLLGGLETRGVGAVIALQEAERRQVVALGLPSNRVEIIPNGVAIEPRAVPRTGEFRRCIGVGDEVPLVLFLGRINRKKGPDMLVEAFTMLATPGVHLAIAGPDDGYLAEAQALVRSLGLQGRVSFPGLLAGVDVQVAFADSDLFVLPSRADTFPMTIVESVRAGTPMVVTDRCEIAHLVRDRVALVTPFDARAFASAMDRLLSDSAERARLRVACPALLEEAFSIERVVDRLLAVYERVIFEARERRAA